MFASKKQRVKALTEKMSHKYTENVLHKVIENISAFNVT